jgi:hypothetical protein
MNYPPLCQAQSHLSTGRIIFLHCSRILETKQNLKAESLVDHQNEDTYSLWTSISTKMVLIIKVLADYLRVSKFIWVSLRDAYVVSKTFEGWNYPTKSNKADFHLQDMMHANTHSCLSGGTVHEFKTQSSAFQTFYWENSTENIINICDTVLLTHTNRLV